MGSFHLAISDDALTVETARRALFLWLHARQTQRSLTVPPSAAVGSVPWLEELRWFELDWDGEAEAGDAPEWLERLPPIADAEPSPWGEWGGGTPVAELRELGVLPEAMVNFLVLLGWQPPPDSAPGEEADLFSRAELVERWSVDQLSTQPARFDLECLRRINHAWLQRADLDRLVELALPYYQRIDWMPDDPSPPQRRWLRDLIKAVLPGLDFLSLLPPRTRLVFAYQPENYLRVPESREAMEREGAREVLRLFSQKALEESWLTVDRYHHIMESLKQQAPWRGRSLHHPVRVLLTGLPFGPSMDDLLPLIEQGAELDLPVRVKSCRERVVEFCSVFV
jgi:glutamyl/glutaminyl-tRNA synthetase